MESEIFIKYRGIEKRIGFSIRTEQSGHYISRVIDLLFPDLGLRLVDVIRQAHFYIIY